MRKLFTYLPFHFLVVLIGGILLQYYFLIWRFNIYSLLLCFGGLCSILFVLKRWNLKKTFTGISLFLFFILGILTVHLNDDRNYSTYYEYHLSKHDTIVNTLVLSVQKKLKANRYADRYIVECIEVNSVKTCGKLVLNIKKDSAHLKIKYGDVLYLQETPRTIENPRNPFQFNYKNYLEKQRIYHQISSERSRIKRFDSVQVSWFGRLIKFREQIQLSLGQYTFGKDELGIMNAMLLGQRQEVSATLIEEYAAAGAIHILAISGLHIGVILIILSSIGKPLEKIKYGKAIKAVFIILCLWMYAIISGMSASVLRAATMFSFVAIGSISNKQTTVYFSLISAMFLLVLIEPLLLFDVGFQLSFIAVFSIVWIQPKLYRIWKPKWRFLDKLWQLSTVSIAAQIGVFPISIYYFQQFPGLFLLTNLVIVPCLSILLFGGMLIIGLALCEALPAFLVSAYSTVIDIMNNFISWVAAQEVFLFKGLVISWQLMLLLYVIIILVVIWSIRRKRIVFLKILIGVIVLQSMLLYETQERNIKQEFIVFHKTKHTILGLRKGELLWILHDLKPQLIGEEHSWRTYKTYEKVAVRLKRIKQKVFFTKTDTLLIIDSLGIYQHIGLKGVKVLLKNSPKVNMNRLISELEPTLIIADGSNYKSYVNRWKNTCLQQHVPFHYTGELGAYKMTTTYD